LNKLKPFAKLAVAEAISEFEMEDMHFNNIDSHEKELTIFFSDITGYTTFAECLTPREVIDILDLYFRQMGSIVKDFGGEIIDYYGDGMLAVFGLKKCICSTRNAVEAGIRMQESLKIINKHISSIYPKPLTIRIGIHYGTVMLGMIGGDGMKKLAVIGDNVNLASRIEQVNKDLSTSFLISECAFKRVHKNRMVKRHFVVNIKGKKGLYKVYEI